MSEKNSAKYAFYYLLSLLALIFLDLSVVLIAFGIINEKIVDALAVYNYTNFGQQFKFAISALIISAPIFYFSSYLVERGLKKEDLSFDSGIRRWLTYFILLVSAVIILGVFVGVINSFLAGELTARFILKAVTLFIVAALVFSFYFYDIRRTTVEQKNKIIKLSFFVSLGLVLTAFVAVWFFIESPQVARNRRLDEILMQNIYQIESAVNSYYGRNESLPLTLSDLDGQDIYYEKRALLDPETNQAIVYNRLSPDTFEFCATFRTASYGVNSNQYNEMTDREHEAGYQCFTGNLWALETMNEKGLEMIKTDN